MPPPKFTPKDWQIIETSPGGVDCDFVNKKTGEETWYTPEGMTAAEILAIPGAKKFFPTLERAEAYIKIKKEEKAKNGGKDIKDV